jgi:MFS family permease
LIIFVLLLVLVLRRLTPEQLQGGSDLEGPPKTVARSSWQLMREVLAGSWRGVPLLLLGILAYTFGFNAIETFFSLYGLTQLALGEDQALALLGLFFLAYLLASVPAGMIGERNGRRKTMIWGLVFLATMLGVAFLVHSVTFLVVLMPLAGMAWALVNSNALPAVVNMAIPQHAGSAVGLYYSAATLASILSPPVNGWLVDLVGGDYGVILLTAGLTATLGAGCLVVTRRPALPEAVGMA